jgi:hypothetical protein
VIVVILAALAPIAFVGFGLLWLFWRIGRPPVTSISIASAHGLKRGDRIVINGRELMIKRVESTTITYASK